MSAVVLREYQSSATDALRAAYAAGRRALLLVMATGGGKTVTFSYIAHGAAARGKRVLIVAHRRELIRQASRKLMDAGVEHGIIAPGFTPTRDTVQVASIQTLANRLDRIGEFDLIVIDEGHHAPAGTYVKLVASQPKAKLLLVTATPERLDGRGLGIDAGGMCDDIVLGPSAAYLIDQGYLTPIKVFAPADKPDLSGVKTRMGEYETKGLAEVMSAPTLVGDAVEHYAKHAPGQPAVVFCVNVEHAKAVAATFRAAGWRATSADGTTPEAERDAALGGLQTGAVQVLCVCDLISEGLDIVGISVVIILRATKSLVNFLQWVGRGLRPVYAPGMPQDTAEQRRASISASNKPYCLVLDHAGCTLQHGMPDSEREWSLEGRPKKQKPPATKQCPECFAIYSPRPVCPECGHADAKPPAEPKAIETAPGELQEMSAERVAAIKNGRLSDLLPTAKTKDDLKMIAKIKGYHHGWVRHVMRERAERA
jgi:superfamily II DNA or RNA helicase